MAMDNFRKGTPFYICLIISVCLFVGGFFCPPMGVIDGSVLKAGGILLGFAALSNIWRIFDAHFTAEFSKGDTHIKLTPTEDKDE